MQVETVGGDLRADAQWGADCDADRRHRPLQWPPRRSDVSDHRDCGPDRILGLGAGLSSYQCAGILREILNHAGGAAISLHQRHLENLLPMIASGEPDYSLPESSLAALEICEAAYLSARHGVEIKFPLDRFEVPAPNDWDLGGPILANLKLSSSTWLFAARRGLDNLAQG